MMKRIEDLIKKWSFDEFDVLSDVELPLEAIPNFTPDMTVEQLNPFTSGSSPIARELCVQWTLLSKVHLLKPFFYQFVYDKIAGKRPEIRRDFNFFISSKSRRLRRSLTKPH